MDTPEARPEPLNLRVASALLEIETADPVKGSRIVLKAVCTLFLILVVWAMFAKLDIVAVAHGRLVPQTYVKIVQPAEAGIIREILVHEGALVTEGQVLARLDPTVASADSTATARELELQKLQLRRIEAELNDTSMLQQPSDDDALYARVAAQYTSHRQSFHDALAQESAAKERGVKELASATELLKKLEAALPIYEETALAYEELANDNLVGAIQAREKRRDVIERTQDREAQRATVAALEVSVAVSDRRLAQVRSAYVDDLNRTRLETISAITRLEQQQQKLNFQAALLELRAPQTGIVKELATTTVGAVVQPGTVLLSLVPQDEPLMAEVSIENQDIGFVSPRQQVRVKIAAYEFQKYGTLNGTVETVSADSAPVGADAQSSVAPPLTFKAIVKLQDQRLTVGDRMFPLAAGMQISAEIVQGKRTILEYLLSPVQRVAGEAGLER